MNRDMSIDEYVYSKAIVDNIELQGRMEKAIEMVYYIEHNIEKYEETGFNDHLDSALNKVEELKELLQGDSSED